MPTVNLLRTNERRFKDGGIDCSGYTRFAVPTQTPMQGIEYQTKSRGQKN